MELKTIILAAGKGTRMKSDYPKIVHKVNGVPMIKKIISILSSLKPIEDILVLGYKKEEVLKELGDVSYVLQEEQLGTGHAVIQAKSKLEGFNGNVLLVCGDTPLLRESTLKELLRIHEETKATTTILTAIYDEPFGYGRIVKENGLVKEIIEEKEASEEVRKIKEVNAGVYCFKAADLLKALDKIDNNNEKKEYYITDVVKIQNSLGEKIESYLLEDSEEILGVNSKVELAKASRILRERKNNSLMEEGVILIDPSNTYVEDTVKIGKDTILHPNVVLQGNTTIGERCEIIGNTRIVDCTIADEVIIETSVLEESLIEDKVTIGPFAHIRPKSHLKETVHIGNFVEVKKSVLEKGVKAGHLTYLGDAIVGEKTNIGAGTITCNYDGKNKFKTNIGENVFVGSSTMLVAPVNIGDNSLIGAGSVITKDVPNRALAIARGKQFIKNEWRKIDE